MREQMGGAAAETAGMKERQVMKSNGKTEPFDHDKLMRSMTNAGASQDEAHQIAMDVGRSNRPMMNTSDIDRMVMDHLKQVNPDAHKNWMQWKQEHNKQ